MTERQSLVQLLALFNLKKKREIEAHCRTLVIRSDDFAGAGQRDKPPRVSQVSQGNSPAMCCR